ncbi:MAG TPA: cytochrome c-type biogenesis protein CcmH [Solirubrobacteraceae bacterium]|jgi:cytochrome c-type biogenesis protein CcmH/NrfF|nr:cytochrome c-type biogenesis protein CcmH [Solirubrobacteraceae bacterium]
MMSLRRLAARVAIVVLAIAGVLAVAGGFTAAGAHAAAKPHVSLALIEREAMCVTCKVALNESQSPQANLEREYIRSLIYQGNGEAEIKRLLVAQYGPTVLGLPGAHGFDLAVYLVPAAVVLALLTAVLLLIPSWRRRARTRAQTIGAVVVLSPEDSARLESDLARFD